MLLFLQVQSVLNSARAAQRQESQGPISQALTPANVSSIEAKAVNDDLLTSQAKFSGQQGAATPSTEGLALPQVFLHVWSISGFKNELIGKCSWARQLLSATKVRQ